MYVNVDMTGFFVSKHCDWFYRIDPSARKCCWFSSKNKPQAASGAFTEED